MYVGYVENVKLMWARRCVNSHDHHAHMVFSHPASYHTDTTSTLSVSTLGDNSLLQIHPMGIRHIRSDKRINEWKPPGKKNIVKCAVNSRQVVVALSDGELIYFEMDKNGQLMDVAKKDMGNDVSSLAIAPIPEGRQRALFMVRYNTSHSSAHDVQWLSHHSHLPHPPSRRTSDDHRLSDRMTIRFVCYHWIHQMLSII